MQNLLTKVTRWSLRYSLTVMFLLLSVAMMAQTVNVSGVVLDNEGDPLPGATIQVLGKADASATSNMDGKFNLRAPQTAVLTVTFVGFKTKTVRLKKGEKFPITISLEDDSKALNEVVVTALGITREQKSLGYARQSIDTESLSDTRDPNLLNSLTGKVSGVNFISNGGPMSSTRVEIRGNNSITGNNQPLYVIDGVPIMNDMGESGDLDYGNAASFISPDDVESIEVLKGANASALYGSDAANGVILITTKKASRKKGIGINYNFNAQFSYLREFPAYQNIYGTKTLRGGINNGGWNYYGATANQGYSFDPNLPYGIYHFNWANQNQRSWGLPMLGEMVVGRNNEIRAYSPAEEAITNLYETGIQLTHNVSIDKVFNAGNLRVSYTGISYDGMLKNFNQMTRHNFSVNSNTNLAKWLQMNFSVNYQMEDVDNRDYKGDSNRNPMRAIMNMPRDATLSELLPYKDADGQPMNKRGGFYNPYWLLYECTNGDGRRSFRANLTFNIKPTFLKGSNLRLRASMDTMNRHGWKFDNMYTMWDTDGYYEQFEERSRNYNYEAVFSYNTRLKKTFLKNLSINANVGASLMRQNWDKITDKVNQLAVPDVKTLSNNASVLTGYSNHSGKEKQGLFGSLSLGYKGFFLDGTARNDWSSALPEGNNSYFYTSESFSAVLTEIFPKLQSKALSFVKLRGSIAKVGNDTGFDRLRDGYSYGNLFHNTYAWYQGDNQKKNSNLKPETTISKEIGLEVRLWKDRVKADVTYYAKNTRDQIVESAVSYGTGYQRFVMNSGEISNKGWEIALNLVPIRIKNFEWRSTINWSKNNSMVESLPDGITKIQIGSGMYDTKSYAEVGKPYGALYAKDYKRNEKGQILCNANGAPKEDPDLHYIGCVQADWRGGWQNTLRYKNISFSMSIDFQKGGHFLSQTACLGATDGQTVQSLAGRYEELFSRLVLNEKDEERYGFLAPGDANTPKQNGQIYPDWQRPKGVRIENCVYDDDVEGRAGEQCYGWVNAMGYWQSKTRMTDYVYDASFIKLREITVSYDFPKTWLRKTPLQNVRLAFVGRNIATLFASTPIGLDPQATSTTGNAQGFERGFNLPEASYGFDIKVGF